jgi:L-iditol 2-dehydrogenase
MVTTRATGDDVWAVMKTAPGAGQVALVERPEPALRPGHVLLDVVSAGVCGTDLHIEAGEYPSVPPVTMGHEVGGVVRAVGDGVDPEWLGARVAVETYFWTCGVCDFCRQGRINLCPLRRSIGTHVDGGFAAVLLVPAANLHRVPDWLPDEALALCEPLACVCHSLCDPPVVSPGDDVLVVGPGTMGLLAAQVAHAAGAEVTVVGAPGDRIRLDAARRRGMTVYTAGADPMVAAGYDVVVECSGNPAGVASALHAARRAGRYVQIGLCGRPVPFDLDEICYRELTVTSGFASTPPSWRRALRLLERRRIELADLVSSVAPLTDWHEVFTRTRAGDGIKFVFDPRLDT